MNKEELETREKLKLTNIAKDWLRTEHSEGNVQSLVNLILSFTEPREKQIQIDAEQILALQKQNGELTDKVKELEAQLAKSVYLMRELMIDIDTPAYGYAESQAKKFIKEIKEK